MDRQPPKYSKVCYTYGFSLAVEVKVDAGTDLLYRHTMNRGAPPGTATVSQNAGLWGGGGGGGGDLGRVLSSADECQAASKSIKYRRRQRGTSYSSPARESVAGEILHIDRGKLSADSTSTPRRDIGDTPHVLTE